MTFGVQAEMDLRAIRVSLREIADMLEFLCRCEPGWEDETRRRSTS